MTNFEFFAFKVSLFIVRHSFKLDSSLFTTFSLVFKFLCQLCEYEVQLLTRLLGLGRALLNQTGWISLRLCITLQSQIQISRIYLFQMQKCF